MKYIFFSLMILLAAACGNKNKPKVGHIKIDFPLERFEKDFFSMDTIHVEESLNRLQTKYGNFLNDYLFHILQSPPHPDSVIETVKKFIHDYRDVYQSAEKINKINDYHDEIVQSLKYVKYYFPEYELPGALITFIGPVEGYANILTSDGIAVGLQQYLGKNYPLYQQDFLRDVYPAYISRRFEPEYISVNSIKNIVEDIYPMENAGKPLIEIMVEKGKQMYLLDRFMPDTADSLKTGYTQQQLEGAKKNEEVIWSFFLQNNLLYERDAMIIRDYISDSPNTSVFGPESPGNIALFCGWQIVKKYTEKFPENDLQQLLKTPAITIFQKSKYKP